MWLIPMLALLGARYSETAAIDDFCMNARSEFVESDPQYFAGPDPWVELQGIPDSFADSAIATVHYEGTRIKWVVLEMQGQNNAWFETTDYFFDDNGAIKKRERRLDQYSSHIEVREDQYFRGRKAIKTKYNHRVLNSNSLLGALTGGQQENWETFYDPEAPYYTGITDLPSVFSKVELKRVAALAGRIQPSPQFFRAAKVQPGQNAEF